LSGDHSDVSSAAGTFGVISALAMPAQIQCFFAQVRPESPCHICIGPDPTGGRCRIGTSHTPVAEKQEANCARILRFVQVVLLIQLCMHILWSPYLDEHLQKVGCA
jgi:hypothetical protein